MHSPALTFVLGEPQDLEALAARRPLAPFAPILTRFAAALSAALLEDTTARRFPELVALGFWLRPAGVAAMIAPHADRAREYVPVPRGLVFHVTPGRMDTMFAYSWLLSMLCGNSNVVRLSSRRTEGSDVLLDIVRGMLSRDEFRDIRERSAVVRYDHSEELTGRFSRLADTRVIWGGDATVAAIRAVPLNPTANEAVFADRCSLAILDAAAIVAMTPAERQALARRFTNDSYAFGQQACSSPRAVLWRGREGVGAAQAAFWPLVNACAALMKHELSAADLIDRRVVADRIASTCDVRIVDAPGGLLTRIEMSGNDLARTFADSLHCGSGLFLESAFDTWDEIEPLFTRRIQTITCAGIAIDEFRALLTERRPRGIDRIVPVGTALEFSSTWDGIDFFDLFLRKVPLTRLR